MAWPLTALAVVTASTALIGLLQAFKACGRAQNALEVERLLQVATQQGQPKCRITRLMKLSHDQLSASQIEEGLHYLIVRRKVVREPDGDYSVYFLRVIGDVIASDTAALDQQIASDYQDEGDDDVAAQ